MHIPCTHTHTHTHMHAHLIEFVEDMSLKPFSSQKPYHKRIAAIKLQSGKTTCTSIHQITIYIRIIIHTFTCTLYVHVHVCI